ncbi:ArsC/Spx/MgsR family protein [Endothiovibrio diazotrophicus]
MATVTFYEKTGCINNTKQKRLLAASGHTVIARDLLKEPWRPDTLRRFFGDRPVVEWFNVTAPSVRDGIIDPATFNEEQALAAMVAEPLLIRRPLMEVEDECRQGFDAAAVAAWIGLTTLPEENVEACPKSHRDAPCEPA